MAVKTTGKGGHSDLKRKTAADSPEIPDVILSVEEAMLHFKGVAQEARAAQIAWIEAFGPPDGWIKLSDAHIDVRTDQSHTDAMNDITRDELTAKLEALESRMDSRVGAIGGKIDAYLAAQAERDKRIDERYEESGKALSKVSEKIESMSSDLHAVRRWQSAYTAGVAILTFGAGLAVTALIRSFAS